MLCHSSNLLPSKRKDPNAQTDHSLVSVNSSSHYINVVCRDAQAETQPCCLQARDVCR